MFTGRRGEVLRALVDRMIPADDVPGGWEAGVGDYLARLFAGDLAAQALPYALGLDALDAEAAAAHGCGFVELADERQDALLARLADGGATQVWPLAPARFVAWSADLCAEGFYGDPANGGNRGGVAWAMIGYDPKRVLPGPPA